MSITPEPARDPQVLGRLRDGLVALPADLPRQQPSPLLEMVGEIVKLMRARTVDLNDRVNAIVTQIVDHQDAGYEVISALRAIQTEAIELAKETRNAQPFVTITSGTATIMAMRLRDGAVMARDLLSRVGKALEELELDNDHHLELDEQLGAAGDLIARIKAERA